MLRLLRGLTHCWDLGAVAKRARAALTRSAGAVRLLGPLLLCSGMLSSTAHGQAARPWTAGVAMHQGAASIEVGPELSRMLWERGLFVARAEIAGLVRVAELPDCQAPCGSDVRQLDAVGFLGLTLEWGRRHDGDRSWYLFGATGVAYIKWRDLITTGLGAADSGAAVLAPTPSIGFGREFAALSGRNRIEVRGEWLHDRERASTGIRIGLSRRW